MKTHLPSTLARARKLRKEMSLPEVLLWVELQKRPHGLKWRKQHPYGRITPDFYCHAAALIVEIDGIAHEMGDQPQVDIERDAMFARNGLHVLRIPARDVLKQLPDTLDAVFALALARAKQRDS